MALLTSNAAMVRGGPGTDSPGQFTCAAVPLRVLIIRAYGLKRYQVSGPAWIDSAGFDIAAKIPAGTTGAQFLEMLRNLLAERFGFTFHREAQEMPIYALVVGKGGNKMKIAEDSSKVPDPGEAMKNFKSTDGFPISPAGLGLSGAFPRTIGGKTKIEARRTTMDSFARMLSDSLGRPVIDMTELNAKYDFALYYAAETATPTADSDGQSIFGALQEQLGLKLEARKGPVEMLIIDRAEKIPTGN